MISINHKSREPLWEQIYRELKNQIFMGVWSAGEQLPSVRALALELSINPNTIQKAMGELEREGLIFSVTGKGSFVEDNLEFIKVKKEGELLSSFDKAVLSALLAGVDEKTLISRIEAISERRKNDDKN